jgi:hypothetical protein
MQVISMNWKNLKRVRDFRPARNDGKEQSSIPYQQHISHPTAPIFPFGQIHGIMTEEVGQLSYRL